MKTESKEKIKNIFKKRLSFEQRMSFFFSVCFAILAMHSLHIHLIAQEIRSLEFNLQSWSDYSYSAYNNTGEIKAQNTCKIKDVEYERNGKYTTVNITPQEITDETIVFVKNGDEFCKADENEGGTFSVIVSGEPDSVFVQIEDENGIYTDEIFLI